VHGEDVRTLLVEASQRGEQIPLEHVITIVMAAASGLHHAHEQRGADGTPLHIVHRDVSPANILVGYDGAVKVADFGIALAAHRAEQTQSGVLKGKVAYMSPEQCNCDPVDRRSDVFSLGIVLYELVTVRPCFTGDNDFMTMSSIVNGKIDRPSEFRKDISPQLEAIIMKALARKAEDRYQTADELRMALEQYATDASLRTSTTSLADYMKTQFGSKALPWQAEDEEPEISMLGSDDAVAATDDDDDDLSVPVDASVKTTMPLRSLDMRPPAEIVVGNTPKSIRVDHRSQLQRKPRFIAARSRKLWLAGSVLAVVIAGLSLILVSTGGGKPMPRASIAPVARPTAPQPIERTVIHQEQPAAAPAPSTPAKKGKRTKRSTTTQKKWDPDALFPQ
jgi:serine/threonine protein kinase